MHPSVIHALRTCRAIDCLVYVSCNPKGSFIKKCNTSTFELEDLVIKEDINELKELISNHYKYTKSSVAEKILLNWTKEVKNFSKVMPTDYKRVLQEMDQKKLKVS